MRLFIESDFAGAGRTMRLRHAFLQTDRFVVGQTWSTFSDPEADPIGIDFEGLNAISRFRQPLFRWTPSGTAARYQWAFAVENPAPDLTGAEGLNFTPDFIARLRYEPGRKRGLALYTGHIQASLLVRQLRGEVPGQAGDTLVTGGIGGNVSGVLVPRWDADDRIKFAVNAGSGIGRYIADLSSLGGQDAVYDPVQVSLRALPVSSGYFGYEHAWSRVFTTAVTYGVVNVSNLDIQLGRCVPPDPADIGQSDVESGSVRGYRRRVPGRHARQQERPARLLESDSERLDAQVLTPASEVSRRESSGGVTPLPNATRLEWMGKYAAILSALVAMAVGIGQYRRGVSQSMRELEWRQADMARTMINGMIKDEGWQAMTMLDWDEGRTYEIAPGTNVRILPTRCPCGHRSGLASERAPAHGDTAIHHGPI